MHYIPMEKPLVPPFSTTTALRPSARIVLPHAFQRDSHLIDSRQNIRAFLKNDLETPKLEKIYRYLWLAGLPRPARFLHRQRLLMRTIFPSESPDEHLVWHDTIIYIKPIPDYLLDYEFWEKHLCDDEVLYRSAYGLLLSYTWLICYKSDHRIAVDHGLLPADIPYDAWNAFALDLGKYDGGPSSLHQVSARYQYGELRLSRLNHLYRLGAAGLLMWNLVFGFTSRSTRYPAFFQRNFGWVVAVFGYFTVLLSAMQVALATERFRSDTAFQNFSYGIAILSVAFVLVAAAIMLLVWSFMFWFHLLSTIRYLRRVESQRAVTAGTASTEESF
ncbi:hypothetical protein F5Y19DRAFT_425138 [Xylariaceae sp. FL1651]|nr:hypothetical protein F5Y19DRAFT_425138 [Xylariaceae sp. FL1651]